jgi:hypothetical protein
MEAKGLPPDPARTGHPLPDNRGLRAVGLGERGASGEWLGTLYAARLGLNKQEDLTLGLWAGYHVLEQLGAPVRVESWGVKQKPAERAEVRKFLEIEQQGGPKAVLNALQQMAPKT